ncbi:MAG: YbaL family putative K(+) efflux transporter, partial [Geminicoccaceae bacterium]
LISTITVALAFAFVGGFIATRFHLPPIVGYLLAGVAVGPFTPGFIADTHLAPQLAEIGVILLMFGVGIHFSLRDLLAVRSIAIPGAVGQSAIATALSVGVALWWGWSLGAGLVLGLALSVASTVVLLRALMERDLLDTTAGRIAVGWLIVEDLATVLALVLLPAVAGILGGDTRGLAGQIGSGALLGTLALTLGKVALFLAVVLLVGQRVIPWILAQVARTGSRELFTLSVLATALGIAYGSAELFGVSFALGAFFAGVVLSESDFSHRAAAESLPLQDAFAVLFFVSVGMLFDPSILAREPLAVLTVLLVILVAKSLAAFAIVLAFRQTVAAALLIAASLAQIGEFSFILAGLGVGLNLLPQDGLDLILAGALLSITLNPLVFVATDWLDSWLRSRPALVAKLERGGIVALAEPSPKGPSGHTVIVGYGRIGSLVGRALQEQGLPVVAVDEDRRRVEELRDRGVTAVYGDATTPGVLEAAGADRARLIVVTTPEGYRARRLVELARQLQPGIGTAVRASTEREVAELEREGVGMAIMGERELAFGFLAYALRSLGTSREHAEAIIQGMRGTGDGGAFERRPDEPELGVPELRPHRAGETVP